MISRVLCFLALITIGINVCLADSVLPDKSKNASRGSQVEFFISNSPFAKVQECYLTLPNGTNFELFPQSNVTDSNIKPLDPDILGSRPCGVKLSDFQSEKQGQYQLKSFRKMDFSEANMTEIQHWTIFIEEEIDTVPSRRLSVFVGETVNIILSEEPPNLTACGYYAPGTWNKSTKAIKQVENRGRCNITLSNLTINDRGLWVIRAVGDFVLYGGLNLEVIEKPPLNDISKTLHLGFPAHMVVGPEDALFCQATDPAGHHYRQNGACSINLDRVTKVHAGVWKVAVGFAGSIRTMPFQLNVNVVEDLISADKITTQVSMPNDQTLTILCSVALSSMKSCNIIRSDGTVFIPILGVGNGRYSYFGKGTYKDDAEQTIVDCGMEVHNPDEEDMKNWQCIITGDNNKDIGAMISLNSVLSNSTESGEGDNSSSVIDNTPNNSSVVTYKENDLVMTCNNSDKIDYCWFKSPMRYIYSPIPDKNNSNYEYFGEGFQYGVCGIRIFNTSRYDHGMWTCNMGGSSGKDVQRHINVIVYDSMFRTVKKYVELYNQTTIGCQTYDNSPVEYCRFIRPDGLGINPSKNVSEYSKNITDITTGKCYLTLNSPSYGDRGLWYCATKPLNKDHEVYNAMEVGVQYYYYSNGWTPLTWILLVVNIAALIIISVVIIKLCSRHNVYRRTRSSLTRNAFRFSKPKMTDIKI